MADKTLTVNGQPFTFNRDRFAGVRTMTAPTTLSDTTTQIQVTVSGHADLDGIYVATPSGSGSLAYRSWNQQGGNGTIANMQADPIGSGNNTEWAIIDQSDGDPFTSYNGVYADDRPWKPSSTGIVTITSVSETITVDRTASVIDSDRAGESRPLLSKVVGGAAVAYSLRDLNDKQGNNKVVEVRRSSGGEQAFLAKEVSNGTLEAWVGAGNDGFVAKWYDQSGNGRHAEQPESTKQPKIVNSGSLVKLSDVPAISFDGSSQFFTTTGFSFSPSGDFLAVTVSKISNGNLIDTRDAGSDGFFLQQGSTFRHRYNGDGAINVSGNDQYILATSELNGTTLTAYKNGASAGTDTSVTAVLSTTQDTTIGRVSFTAANHVAGSIQEIILYDTDQSANRPAIEANINNQYDIY